MYDQVDKITSLVTVVDENNGLIQRAVVHAIWTMPDGPTIEQYNYIGVRGRAEFKVYPTISGIYTLTVIDITKNGYTFDPSNSVVLTKSIEFTVPSQNQAPTAVASADTTSGPAPLAVNFSSAGSTDPDGSIVAYAWDFGDGGSSMAANPNHTYNAAGSYVAMLTVTDDKGATASDSIAITVTGTTGCSVNCLRVFNIEMFDLGGKVTGLVYMVDENGGGVRSVVVHAVWTMPDGSTVDQYANIGTRGRAEFRLYPMASGLYTLTVVGATKSGYTFDPDNSAVLSASINVVR